MARWYELTQQQRSIDDSHTAFVTGNYRGRTLTLDGIQGGGYKILTREDSTDMEWVKAPILVSTNRERQTLTHTRSVQFAKATNNVVVRWRTKHSKWRQQPLLQQHRHEALKDPCFYEYFVEGADAFLTENIQKDLGLANATAAVYHSLVLDEETRKEFDERLRKATPGEVIDLTNQPLAINMEIQMDNEICSSPVRNFLREIQTEKTKFSRRKRNHTAFVLPIWQYSCKIDSSETTVRGGLGFHPSKVTLQKYFPVEPAFAITVHKSEGRTMDRVIIALSSCKAKGCDFSYAQVHVAFSRVRRREHIRLLLTGDNVATQWESIMYLDKLTPKPSIDYYFGGFRSELDFKNPNVDWLANNWSLERANANYKEKRPRFR